MADRKVLSKMALHRSLSLVFSVSDDNELQVWQVAQNIYGDGPVVSTPAGLTVVSVLFVTFL